MTPPFRSFAALLILIAAGGACGGDEDAKQPNVASEAQSTEDRAVSKPLPQETANKDGTNGIATLGERRVAIEALNREAANRIGLLGAVPANDPDAMLVREVGQRLAYAAQYPPDNHWRVRPRDWTFALLLRQERNAGTGPNDEVWLSAGILTVTQTPGGLAAVMGHEMGHILANHSNERGIVEAVVKVPAMIVAGAVGIASVVATGGSGHIATGLIEMVISNAGNAAVRLPWSRSQELEADKIGMILMARAGFDPREAIIVQERLTEMEAPSNSDYGRTHPNRDLRLERMRAALPEAMKYFNPHRTTER